MSKESIIQNKDSRNNYWFQKILSPAVLVSFILLLGGALRSYHLGTESYWVDEVYTIYDSQLNIHQLIFSGRLDRPPAYYLPFQLWTQYFGTSEVGTRSFSALAGLGSIILIFLVGKELFGKEVGLISAFLMAISGFQIEYSQEARFYSFFEFMTLASFLFFILALNRKRIIYFAFYAVASILMVYSHAYGIFVLAAQNLFFILQIKKYRDLTITWFICQAAVFLAILPYFLPSFYPQTSGKSGLTGAADLNIGNLPVPSLLDPLRSVYRYIIPPRREQSWEIVLVNYIAAGLLLLIGTWIYATRQGRSSWVAAIRGSIGYNLQKESSLTTKLLLVSFWLVFPIVLPFIISIIIVPIYLDRYTISAAPALYLLLALGIFRVQKVIPLIISIGILLILVIPGLRYYYVTDIKEQWREAAAYVDENAGPNEVIVFAPNQGEIGVEQSSFNWYYRGVLKGCGLGIELKEPDVISKALIQCISGHNRFWVIIRDNPEANSIHFKSFLLDPNQTAIDLIKEHHFVGVSVYLFELKK